MAWGISGMGGFFLDLIGNLRYLRTMKMFEDLPLRERKQSKTRIAIYHAVIRLLKERYLNEIKVEEICREVDISRGTFFSYFTRKSDLIVYSIRLWSIGAGWEYNRTPEAEKGVAYIHKLFHELAEIAEENPNKYADIMAFRAFSPNLIHAMNTGESHMVSLADRLYYYPNMDGVADIPEGTIVTYLRKNLIKAKAKGELPGTLDEHSALISLTSLLYGALNAAMGNGTLKDLKAEYDRQLAILWAGLKAVYA